MANPPPTRRQRGDPDRLSRLPDDLLITILSLLPTCAAAARTSVLSRRFRHLWKASPSLDLALRWDPSGFEAMANCALLSRRESNPLLSLRLHMGIYRERLPGSFWRSLLAKAHSLGLRHLTLAGDGRRLNRVIPTVFSMDSLHSLHLDLQGCGRCCLLSSAATFTRLKSLSFTWHQEPGEEIGQLLSQLPFLQDLRALVVMTNVFTLSSKSIRNLHLEIYGKPELLALYTPSLEMLQLRMQMRDHVNLPRIQGGTMPSLRKAIIILRSLRTGDAAAVAQLPNCVSTVKELSLDINESCQEKYPFPLLFEPGKDAPNFPKLKHLYANMCFHKHNFESIIALLRRSSVLESLKLVHEVHNF